MRCAIPKSIAALCGVAVMAGCAGSSTTTTALPPPPAVWSSEPYGARFQMSPFSPLSVAIDASGAPVAATYDGSGPDMHVTMKRWTGQGWTDLADGPLAIPAGVASFDPRITARPDGELVASWFEIDTNTSATAKVLRAVHRVGTAWEPLGDPFSNAAPTENLQACRVAAAATALVIAYADPAVHVALLGSSGWQVLPPLSYSGTANEYALAIGGDERPVVAWIASGVLHAARWEPAAGTWADLPSYTTDPVASAPDVAIAADGSVFAAYDSQNLEAPIRLLPGGSAWERLALPSLPAISVPHPRIALSSGGALSFAWGNPHIGIARWSGGTWEIVATAIDSSVTAQDPAIAVAADGSIRMVWNDEYDNSAVGHSFMAGAAIVKK